MAKAHSLFLEWQPSAGRACGRRGADKPRTPNGSASRLSMARRLLCLALDITTICAMSAAAVCIAAFYWFTDDRLDAVLLHSFSRTFIAGVVCFGAARCIELAALVLAASSESRVPGSQMDATVPAESEASARTRSVHLDGHARLAKDIAPNQNP